MQTPLKSMEQLMPFATAGELIAKKAQPVVPVTPETTVSVAMERMTQMEVGLVVVLHGDQLAGVVSERGLCTGGRAAVTGPAHDAGA